jgi:hypothetical protein
MRIRGNPRRTSIQGSRDLNPVPPEYDIAGLIRHPRLSVYTSSWTQQNHKVMTVEVGELIFVVAFSGQLKYSGSVLNYVFRFNRIF